MSHAHGPPSLMVSLERHPVGGLPRETSTCSKGGVRWGVRVRGPVGCEGGVPYRHAVVSHVYKALLARDPRPGGDAAKHVVPAEHRLLARPHLRRDVGIEMCEEVCEQRRRLLCRIRTLYLPANRGPHPWIEATRHTS